jgi:hypothetical protein
MYLLVFHTYINEMHGSGSKITSNNLVHILLLFTSIQLLGLFSSNHSQVRRPVCLWYAAF